MNLFATVLTYPAPSANYRGESELSRAVLQKVTDGRLDFAIYSPESMRNAFREIFRKYILPCNRERIHPVSGKSKSEDGGEGDKQGLAVKFSEYPDPNEFIDDFFFGYLLAVKGKELDKLRKEKGALYPLKRDSVFRMNLAKALDPYRHNAIFTQSPEIKDSPWKPGGGDSKSKSGLLHRETVVSAFQYPFALALADCEPQPEWTKKLLQAIGELNGVAGNHARSYFEMAPASIVVRLTKQLVAGSQTYGFTSDGKFPEVIDGILHDPQPDYPGQEFYLGGKLVKDLEEKFPELAKKLADRDVTLDRDPRRLLATVADKFLAAKE